MFPKFLRVVTAKTVEYFDYLRDDYGDDYSDDYGDDYSDDYSGDYRGDYAEDYDDGVTQKPFIRDQQQLDVVAQALGFSYEVVFAPDGEGYGERLPNGSWTKALGMIQRGEADLLFGSLEVTEERQEEFRLIFPHSVEEVTFMTKKHEYVPKPAILLNIFSTEIWISILVCLCLVPFAFRFLLRKKYSPVDLCTSSFAALVAQGMELAPRRLREYIVLASWILSSSLLYNFYLAFLFSFLTSPTKEGVKTFEDLANAIQNGKYHCETYEYSIYPDILSSHENPSLQIIGNVLKEKSAGFDYFVWYLEGSDDNKQAFVGRRSEFFPYKDIYFISEMNFFTSFVSFATHNEFCCGSELDKVMHRIWASGIYEKIIAEEAYDVFTFDMDMNSEYWDDPPSDIPINMTLLKGPFIFLIISHSVAFLVFLIEVCVGKLKLL